MNNTFDCSSVQHTSSKFKTSMHTFDGVKQRSDVEDVLENREEPLGGLKRITIASSASNTMLPKLMVFSTVWQLVDSKTTFPLSGRLLE